MSISEEKLKSIAFLARLDVDEVELKKLTTEINNILDLMSNLDKIDTRGVEPMYNSLDMLQKFREDKVIKEDDYKKLQEVAPNTDNGYFLVPKVIE